VDFFKKYSLWKKSLKRNKYSLREKYKRKKEEIKKMKIETKMK
jgi:hypothetical protein